MNYYERHLGDYAKDTAHLSMLEHGAAACCKPCNTSKGAKTIDEWSGMS